MTTLREDGEQTWIDLGRAYRSVLDEVEGALKAAGLPPLEWYDVLIEIERAGNAGVRPVALQERMLLPQYGMSRLLDRMARHGMIEKRPSVEDRRGFDVFATALGRRTRRKMWPVYAGALERSLQNRLSKPRLRELSALLSAVPKRESASRTF